MSRNTPPKELSWESVAWHPKYGCKGDEGSPCLVWTGEERNDLIQIIGDSETIALVNPEILNITNKDELNYWLSKFVVEV